MIATLRKILAEPKTSWQLCLLAILGGCASASLVILFSLFIDAIKACYQAYWLNYNSLTFSSRILLPLSGILIILCISKLTGYQYIRAGIPFVLHRLKISYGVIPFRNTLNQFVGGAIALATGFSVGKEGPSVHLGAACASYIGNKIKLPYNAIRTLCACGIAAGISACFNTPIAAVIFVMEVILREYKIHIFIPIMLAAIVGSLITQTVFGPAHNFEFFVNFSLTFAHYPYLILLALFLGVLAAGFNHQLTYLIEKVQHIHIVKRFLVAALITALLSYLLPNAFYESMEQVSLAVSSEWTLPIILLALAAKLLMTIFAIGLGIPGGIIGPIVAIGSLSGILAAYVISAVTGSPIALSDLALMGMAGFMAATLNAPLAALLAVVELSNQLEVVVPAMITIAVACLSSGQFFNNRSIFTMQLDVQNLAYRKPPIESFLQNIGVLGVMQENINFSHSLQGKPNTNAITLYDNEVFYLSKPENDAEDIITWHEITNKNEQLQVHHRDLFPLSSQATLAEAYAILHTIREGGVYIYQDSPDHVIGVIPFEQIRRYLTVS